MSISEVTITSHDDARTPPHKPVLKVSMDERTVTYEIWDDEIGSALARVVVSQDDNLETLNFLSGYAHRLRAAAGDLDG